MPADDRKETPMPRVLATFLLALALLGAGVPEAHAFGPFCFQLTPFPNVVVWFVDPSGGNQFEGSGRDLTQNAAQTVGVVLSGSTAFVTFVTGAGSAAGSIPYVASTEINLGTSSGPGRFTNIRSEGPSPGTFTTTAVACPPSATASTAPDPGRFPGVAIAGAPAASPEPTAPAQLAAPLEAQGLLAQDLRK
jgi:hypothetical protein